MTYVFLTAVCASLVVSAFCSLTEAALYSVPFAYVKHKAESGSRAARLLLLFKKDVSRPIAGILIFNTIANTAGAAISGWAAAKLFGEQWLVAFSVVFTLLILYCSEILPKLIGVVHCKQVSLLVAWPLSLLLAVAAPLIWLTDRVVRRLKKGQQQPAVSPQEFLSLAALGTQEGALDHFEGSVIMNVVGLDQTLVKEILTPRVVVFRKRQDMTLQEAQAEIGNWNFSRVPLYAESDPELLNGYVTQRDIYRELLQAGHGKTLKDLARPLKTVPELMRADKLLLQMFEEREQICAVVDERGGLAGIVTLEDMIEEVVGREIVDEYDTVSDLRSFAKILRFTKHRRAPSKSGGGGPA